MKPTDLRGILQYVPHFREKAFVISLDGAIVADENFPNIILDIAVLRSLNIRVVIVHGASAQIRALAESQGVQPSDLDGSGITDAQTLNLAITAASRITQEILEGLATQDLRAACPNAIVAHPMGIIHGVDHLFTGKVERVDSELLQALLTQGVIPVIPPLGFDGEGRTYRVNSDAIAVAVAEAIRAVKIIYVTTYQGLFKQGRLFRQILASDLEQWLAQNRNDFQPSTLSKAIHAAAACRAGIPRVHIIDGRLDEALLTEVFSNEGIGTLIYANEYQQIRRAMKKDIPNILKLIRPAMESDELLRRTRSSIEKSLGDFYLFEIDQNPVACVALHTYPEVGKAEIACLCVKPSHENQGIGRKLVQYAENKARELGMKELVALSTQSFMFFISKAGFQEGSPEDLPPARRERYEQSGRKSKVLIKKLQ
ncbi:MAG: amino-acid N-acetyltransferase [Verrucomicrobiae bacterium]|nr:amino-acid N-acetyltransferase [Verrucomicrobiae bacterium]